MSYRRGFLGTDMAQNALAVPTFDEFLARIGKPARVIEIGTSSGGLALFLALYCQNVGAEFTTIDIQFGPKYAGVIRKLGGRRLIGNCFDMRFKLPIHTEMRREGVTVLLCDGGNKVAEFNEFASSLKVGDYILAHDFADSRKTWVKDEHWKCCEIELADVAQTIAERNLERFMPDEFTRAAWGCFRRKPE